MKVLAIEDDIRDDVDHLIDRLIANPDTVDDVKTLLRHKMTAPDKVSVAHCAVKAVSAAAPSTIDDEVDELWDNVPV